MMKKIIIGLFTLTSALCFAQEINPLAVTSDGTNVLGCFARFKSQNSSSETVVFRIFKGLNSFVINENKIGMTVVLTGEQSTNSRGLTGSYMPFESQINLPDYYNENWSYPTPESTILAVRGNLIGFFLKDNAEGLVARHRSSPIFEEILKCTSDKAVLLEKIKSVMKFSPL